MSAAVSGRLIGAGGLSIYWQRWLPDLQPRAVVVIAHGAGEHSDRYRHVVARLLSEGYAAYAIEHRGHGRSDGKRALIDRLDNAVSDLGALIERAGGEHPGLPLFLIGHSMGGTIAISYALRDQSRLSGLILSGPLAALQDAPLPLRLTVKSLSVLAPRLPLIAIDPSGVSRDPAVVEAYIGDPLVHHGKLPVRTIAELAQAIEAFPGAVSAITAPTLIMYGSADQLCPPEGSVMLAERIGTEDVTMHAYDGLYHEVFNEPEQDRVLDDLCSWIQSHARASDRLPSSSSQPLR